MTSYDRENRAATILVINDLTKDWGIGDWVRYFIFWRKKKG